MFKEVFLKHWLDWTIAIIIMVFILLMGAIQRYSIEQDYSFTGDEIFYTIKLHARHQQQNTVDTSGWKTYRNEKYGFELKYPVNYKTPVEGGTGINFGNSSSPFEDDGRLYIDIKIYNGEDLQQMLDKDQNTPRLAWGGSGVAYYNIRKYLLDGQEGLRFDSHGEGGVFSNEILLPYNAYLYRIFYNTEAYVYETDNDMGKKISSIDEFDKILSTLKFFEPTAN